MESASNCGIDFSVFTGILPLFTVMTVAMADTNKCWQILWFPWYTLIRVTGNSSKHQIRDFILVQKRSYQFYPFRSRIFYF